MPTDKKHSLNVSDHHHWASLVAQMVKNLPAVQETWFNPWVRKISWRKERLPILEFLPGESHG